MEQNLYPEQLDTAKARILACFRKGVKMTSYEGNIAGNTVDFRKIVSTLRAEGHLIKDFWRKAADGRKFKVYYLEQARTPEA